MVIRVTKSTVTVDQRTADAITSFGQIRQLILGRRPVVVLDLDRTLRDDDARGGTPTLVAGAREALTELATHCPVVVMSGRDLDDLRGQVKADGVWLAGCNGFDVSAPDGRAHRITVAGDTPKIADASAQLAAQLEPISGITLEHNSFGIIVHLFRADPQCVPQIVQAVRRFGHCAGLQVRDCGGDIELRPVGHGDNGAAYQWIVDLVSRDDHGSSPTILPLYLGGGSTNPDVLDAIRRSGLEITVAREGEHIGRQSNASFRLENCFSAVQFLHILAAHLKNIATESADSWQLVYESYDPEQERLREALCTVGNGYIATRGCAPEAFASEAHYPGTYAAGVCNSLTDEIAGRAIANESLVNLPNWLALTFRIDGGSWFDLDEAELLAYRQTFDLRNATLTRRLRIRDNTGRITTLEQQRFASMQDPHILAMKTTICAENWSAETQVRSLVDAGIGNTLVARYRSLASIHLTDVEIEDINSKSVLLSTETSQSGIAIAIAARNTAWSDRAAADARHSAVREPNRGGHEIQFRLCAGQSVTIEKVVVIVTSRDAAISEPAIAAKQFLHDAGRYADLYRRHNLAWARLWEQCGVTLDDDPATLRILRLHMVHLLQTISPHTAEMDAGVPARGLHGEAYRGHIFWDASFISPVLTLRLPNAARSLLLYRYRRLPAARSAALDAGYRGAMYPWQSGTDGREVSQQLHLNPQSRRWIPDSSALAHHVGLAVAYDVWQYYQATGDRQFLVDYGAEMLVEIARFWVCLAGFDPMRDRYSIRHVIGPDEFHSGYPGRDHEGIDNNAYTNVMAVWVILRTLDALTALPLRNRLHLIEKTGLTTQELDQWDDVSRRMFIPFHDNVISQFERYADLAELDWDRYRQQYGNIRRLDRILEAEGDSVNNYRASKQADVLMLFYLLSSEDLLCIFERLGYQFTPEQIPQTVSYYMERTSHGSTLSETVHSWVLARANRQHAMDLFKQVLLSDVADVQGGTTAEGVHLAAMAGSIDLLQRCFTGLQIRQDQLSFSPCWPAHLGAMEFPFAYRGQQLHLRISGRGAVVSSDADNSVPIDVECRGQVKRLCPGHVIEVQ